ncbi:MAG: hypothetical protein AAF298_20780 [Cyanobacteria bacterium P01_A01_bin.40]
MRIVHVETLISQGSFSKSSEWLEIRNSTLSAVRAADWPPGSGTLLFILKVEKSEEKGMELNQLKMKQSAIFGGLAGKSMNHGL